MSIDALKAIRFLFIEQVGVELERVLRLNFRQFYEREVTNMKKLRVSLVDYKKTGEGGVKMKPSG